MMNNQNNQDQQQQQQNQQQEEEQQVQEQQQQQEEQQEQSSDSSDYEDIEDKEDQESYQLQEENINEIDNNKKDGCEHYKTKCKIRSPCCNNWYQCRLCHDEDTSKKCKIDKLDRYNIKEIKCDLCDSIQETSQICNKCNIKFCNYFCSICNLFTDDSIKKVYHCDDCKICRMGNKGDYVHCKVCNGDFSAMFPHKCIENSFKSNCFLCLENIFDSKMSAQQLNKCGHFMHTKCLAQYLKNGYQNCPVCNQSIQKEPEEFIKYIDEMNQKSQDQIPEEFKDKKLQILCNNCNQKSQNIPFNFYGLKCTNCGSYNTKEYV